MNRIFISYSGDRGDRAKLVSALKNHGLNPWRDADNLEVGDAATDTIEAELAECSGIILWINEAALNSAYIVNVELPAIAKAWRARRIRIVPVFDGLSPVDASERVARFGIEIGEANGHVIDPEVDTDTNAAAIASRYVRAHIKDCFGAGHAPVVRMVTYDDTAAFRDTAILNFDWRHQLSSDELDPVSQQRLSAALSTATSALKAAYGATAISLAIKAHLGIAVAVGAAFSEPTGCTLAMARDGVNWFASRSTNDAPLLELRDSLGGPVSTRDSAIEVSISRDTESGVNSYIAEGQRYRHRLVISPSDGIGRSSLPSPEIANAWARQIGDAITSAMSRSDVDRLDLFLAVPVELAAAIGWWTNAAGPIRLMNWTGKTGPYRPLWMLP